jgi:hypothetical protein
MGGEGEIKSGAGEASKKSPQLNKWRGITFCEGKVPFLKVEDTKGLFGLAGVWSELQTGCGRKWAWLNADVL